MADENLVRILVEEKFKPHNEKGNNFAARGFAGEIRRHQPYNRTALYILAEMEKIQKQSALGSRNPDWFRVDLENCNPERVVQNIAEAYKDRGDFKSAFFWIKRGLGAYPKSTKLQC